MAIHPTAIVESGAEVDLNVEIGPGCIIGSRVRIQSGTKLMAQVVVRGKTKIGARNVFYPFSVIGGEPQDLKYDGEETELILGDDNTIREFVTLNLGTVQGGGKTVIGNSNLIMAYVHVGHDSKIGNSTVISNAVNLAGHVEIGDYAVLGGQVGMVQFRRVGQHAYVGGQVGIVSDIPPYSVIRRPCEVAGANLVGLRRRGFAPANIHAINDAIALWSRGTISKDDTLREIEQLQTKTPEVEELLKFIRESQVGVAR